MSRSERKSRRKQQQGAEELPTDAAPPQVENHFAESPPAIIDAPAEAAPEITVRDIPQPNSLGNDSWPMREWPAGTGERGAGFQVVLRRSALNAIHRHGQATPDVEICGVVVGNVFRDDAGPFLLIETIVRGNFAGSANAQVTFTAETWNHIQGVMEAEHPDQKIVGWYHTHPSFGIFLSDMDLFIHGHFFNLPWQVAFVYDPASGEDGIFVWKDGKTERGTYAIDEDEERELVTLPVSPEITAAALADFSRRMQAMERRSKRTAIWVCVLLVVALAWPFVLFTVMGERRGNVRPKAAESTPTTEPAYASDRPPRSEGVAAQSSTKPSTQPAVVVSDELWRLLRSGAPTTQPVQTPSAKSPLERVTARQVVPEVIRPTTSPSIGAKVIGGSTERSR